MSTNIVVAKGQENITDEVRFSTLNQRGFVRAETAEYQWYLLVCDACTSTKIPVDEVLRDYLATMLCRFTKRPEFMEQLSAFDFYKHCLGVSEIDEVCVQDIADICLQYVALFPERSYNRHEPRSLEHVSNMGTHLYFELAKSSKNKDDWFSRAYQVMSKSFGLAVIVLRSVLPRFILNGEISKSLSDQKSIPFLGVEELSRLAPSLQNFNSIYLKRGLHQN
ncbi:hypothetical protein K9M47_02125 [Candidatus Gracilibacteria bacterium]|nr:hypothetical protein [Candidatus Gracilibacteria bacterium]MCF7898746.1 hypothetical protein [Candidatus Paceibacterota bacterium]